MLETRGKKAELLRACWAPSTSGALVLATGSADGTVLLWGNLGFDDARGAGYDSPGRLYSKLRALGRLDHRNRSKGLDGQIYSCQFVVDAAVVEPGASSTAGGTMNLLTASDCSVHLWDVATQQRRVSRAFPKIGSHSIGGERNPDDLPFVFDAKPRPGSGSSTMAVALSDSTVRVGDVLRDGGQPCVLHNDAKTHLTGLAWSEDGATLVSCAGNGSVTVWEPRTWTARSVLRGHGGPVYGATFFPAQAAPESDGAAASQLLVSWSSDGTICTWDLSRAPLAGTSPLEVLRVEARFPVFHCALAPDGSRLAIAGGDASSSFVGVPIKLVDISTEEVREMA